MAVIETTIEGRYQVINRIAAGGMGEVFRAHDAVLQREVAVKVLHAHLAGDRGFVDRFRREARAAAILNHPNIVGVYDWGVTENTYFMVMEYVPGVSLRSLLSHHGRLEPAQVTEVAFQVLAALEHAHGHGIVHRDIKPENILIARDGSVKVADFGLARAYADSHVSQTEGTVTGTVQYLAPEQIQGEPADPRTDLYALGVVMFELLTGRPPFAGETSLAIAYAHLSGRVPAPSSVVRTVPAPLDQLVVAATEPDRADRPSSARKLRDEVALAGMSLPPAPRVAELAGQVPSAVEVPEDRATTVTIPRAMSPKARRRKRLRWAVALTAVAAALVVGGLAAWVYAVPHYTHVPRLDGRSVKDAAALLTKVGLETVTGDGEFSHTVKAGIVLRTLPGPGLKVRKGSKVTLIPSNGPQLGEIPDVTGQPEDFARQRLTDAGFKVKTKRDYSESVAEGNVISQNPNPKQQLEVGTDVTILLSKGPAPVPIPDVRNRPVAEAEATLGGLGFKVGETQEYSVDVAKGNVIDVDPAVGTTAASGSTVTLVVSLGPKTVVVPDLVGMTREEAVAKLRELGLRAQPLELPSNSPPNTVVFQDPPPDTRLKQGDVVTIYVTSP
jgi:beta-lactam-binding protein with PASTA domain/predicted Ser/Thr protein kinase